MIFRQNNLWRVFFVAAAALSIQAAPTSEQIRKAALDYVVKGQQEEGVGKIAGYVEQQMGRGSRVSTRELGQLAIAAECVRFMELTKGADIEPALAEWLLSSGERLHQVVDIFEPADKPADVFRILGRLKKHAPADADTYFNLMLAIAVVFDEPGSGKMHGQMGRELIEIDRDPLAMYDYFKQLYASGDAKINYGKLGATELVFVVVPAPISELEWAKENVKGSLNSWDEKYSDIEYDRARLSGSRFQWDNGLYKLSDIETKGGICVDQAYYAVLTARAHGIPALYFHGSGKSANHAWFGYMKGRGDWVVDVGRYQNDAYTTGYTINPQTNRQMTDHDVEYAQERSRHSRTSDEASAYVSIAEVLKGRDPESALKCAREARELEKRSMRAWDIEQRILVQQEDYDGLVELYYDKKDAFRKYPDILVGTARSIAEVLRKGGRNDEADDLLKNVAGAVDDDRDDLARSFENQRINEIIKSGDTKKARKELEQMLDDQKDQGNKIFGLIRQYIRLTKDSGQTREAVKFLEDYIEDLIEEYGFPPRYEQSLLELLLTVYQSDGDTREAEELKKRIERLRLQQNM